MPEGEGLLLCSRWRPANERIVELSQRPTEEDDSNLKIALLIPMRIASNAGQDAKRPALIQREAFVRAGGAAEAARQITDRR